MRKSLRWFLSFIVCLGALLVAQRAEATHFRYGNITWRVPDPMNAPLTVEFTVTVGWRATMLDTTILDFGDGGNNGAVMGVQIGGGTDFAGEAYSIFRYTATHTYATSGFKKAFFEDCCRLSSLINAGDDMYRVEADVFLEPDASNTSGPVSGIPVIIQMEVGTVNTFVLPVFDPDADPHTCTFSSGVESGIAGPNPPCFGAQCVSFVNPGCSIQWDLSAATNLDVGNKYAVSIEVNSQSATGTSKATVDYIIEFVPANSKPVCSGGGNFVANIGQLFQQSVTATDPSIGTNNLTLGVNNQPAGSTVNPISGTTQPEPFTATFSWTPALADAGQTYLVQFVFVDATNLFDFCTMIIEVPLCNGFGQPCCVGVGACQACGTNVCQGSMTVCSATPGQPTTEVCANQVDEDCDGNLNNGCADTDGDGIIDAIEDLIGSDPNDADSDDDGVPDGEEPGQSCFDDPSCFVDSDGDLLINVLDPDSDNDGLLDGTEMGFDCSNADTDPAANNCIADGDAGTTVTDPLDPDTDDGGVSDGSEDVNLNGVVDGGRTDPTTGNGSDDNQNGDSDGDGLSDDLEDSLGTDPMDADSDDDGIPDGEEPNPTLDTDGDGLINPLDPDSDDDGLYDGTELGYDCSNPDTDLGPPPHCIPDGDLGATKTSPLLKDTDMGGVSDGSEDANLNGVVDGAETDPTPGNGGDDSDAVNLDSDGDGLSDALELFIGSDPMDADSDDDGLIDAEENNPADDTDEDGNVNIIDEDADGDGLFDGTEEGKDCNNPDTDVNAGNCTPDADGGATTTNHLIADTDGGGVPDGDEDENQDGKVDPGEGDPNDPVDDGYMCIDDNDCPDGSVCDDDTHECVPGCHTDADCLPEEHCDIPQGETVGQCVPDDMGTGGMGGAPTSGVGTGGNSLDGLFAQGGCSCETTTRGSNAAWLWLLVVAGGVGGRRASRRRAR